VIVKTPILNNRIRKVPKGFSWIDHRLIQDRHIDLCSHAEAALYLFLVCVSDDKGLSFYGDKSIMKTLSMDQKVLADARSGLINNSLIAWQKPVYQVLCIEPVKQDNRMGSFMSLRDILGGLK
jgi:hypothetical protein